MSGWVVRSVVAVVVLVTLVSGTQLGSSMLVDEPEASANPHPPGSGNATVRVDSLPERATIERGEYGAGSYYLRVPPAQVTVVEAEKQPLLTYKIRLPEMGYVRSTVRYIGPQYEGPMTLTIEEYTFGPDRIQQDEYRGELIVLVRANNEAHVVAQANITVTVER